MSRSHVYRLAVYISCVRGLNLRSSCHMLFGFNRLCTLVIAVVKLYSASCLQAVYSALPHLRECILFCNALQIQPNFLRRSTQRISDKAGLTLAMLIGTFQSMLITHCEYYCS